MYKFNLYKRQWSQILYHQPLTVDKKSFRAGPSERFGHTLTSHKQVLALFGGFMYKGRGDTAMRYSNGLHIFELFSRRWLDLSPSGIAPPARYKHSALVVNNNLYIIGGGTSDERFEDIYFYGFDSNTWGYIKCSFLNQIQSKDGHAILNQIVSYNNQNTIIILGGYQSQSKNNYMCMLNVVTKTVSKEKVTRDFSFLDSFQFFTYQFIGRYVYVFGGRTQEKKTNDCFMLNMQLKVKQFEDECRLQQQQMNLLEHSQVDPNVTCADVKIEIQKSGYSFHCHKSILKYRAKYLYQLISHDIETYHTIQLNTLDKDSLLILLQYVYSANFSLQGLTMQQVITLFLFIITSDDHTLIKLILIYMLTNFECKEYIQVLPQLQDLLIKNILDETQKALTKSTIDIIVLSNEVLKATSKLSYINSLKQLIRGSQVLYGQEMNQKYQLQRDYLILKEDTALSDFKLCSQGQTHLLHKCILFAASEFFQTMFSFQKEKQMDLSLEVDPPILNTVINYFYQGFYAFREVTFSIQAFQNILRLLDYFQISNQDIIDQICYKMQDNMNLDNIQLHIQFADQNNLEALKTLSYKFIQENIATILKEHPTLLMALDKEQLVHIITTLSNEAL